VGPVRVTWLGLATNLALGLLKLALGLALHAQALVADGLHSMSDLVTDVAVLAGLRISSKPPDANHHYGHRRITTLVTASIGVVLLFSAAWIIYEAITTYREPHPVGSPALGLDVHILVDPGIRVVQGHDIATMVQKRLLDGRCGVIEAVVHVEPRVGDDGS